MKNVKLGSVSVLILSMVLASPAFAEEPAQRKDQETKMVSDSGFKLILGANIGQSSVSPTSMIYGFGFGGILGIGTDFAFTESFGMEADFLYTGRVSSLTNSGGTGSISLSYFLLPVLARFNLSDRFHIGAGGYLGFQTGSFYITEDSTGLSVPFTFSGNTLDYGLAFGAGAALPLGTSTALTLDGRLNIGLANATKVDGSSWKYMDIMFLAGLRFGF